MQILENCLHTQKKLHCSTVHIRRLLIVLASNIQLIVSKGQQHDTPDKLIL